MATAPKPWLDDPRWPARRRAHAAAKRAAWPAPKDAAEAGLRALQPYGGKELQPLVVVKCATQAHGKTLAWVCATDDGPVFWSVITRMTPDRYDAQTEVLRRMRTEQYPGQFDELRRNRALLKARGAKLRPMFPTPAKRLPLRRDVFDLLEAPGPHPDLATNCRKHGLGIVERDRLLETVHRAVTLHQQDDLDRPLVLGIRHPPHSGQ